MTVCACLLAAPVSDPNTLTPALANSEALATNRLCTRQSRNGWGLCEEACRISALSSLRLRQRLYGDGKPHAVQYIEETG
jgi:hypothetical protein